MGIVSFCPQGHRIKVKDRLAGKTGVCPTCGARFRIPLASVEPPAAGGGAAPLTEAKIMSLDATIAARLPRVLLLNREPEPVRPGAIGHMNDAPCKPAEDEVELVVEEIRRHPMIAERPDLAWCLAVPGGTASEPRPADAIQAWLDAGRATGDELVWRADWYDWRPIAGVFPECLRR